MLRRLRRSVNELLLPLKGAAAMLRMWFFVVRRFGSGKY